MALQAQAPPAPAAGATITAGACSVVYIEVACQLLTVAEFRTFKSTSSSSVDMLAIKLFCNGSSADDSNDSSDSALLVAIRHDRNLFLALTVVYALLLASLAAMVAFTALQLRFDILKAKYYHRRGWRGLLKLFSRAVRVQLKRPAPRARSLAPRPTTTPPLAG